MTQKTSTIAVIVTYLLFVGAAVAIHNSKESENEKEYQTAMHRLECNGYKLEHINETLNIVISGLQRCKEINDTEKYEKCLSDLTKLVEETESKQSKALKDKGCEL